MLNFMHTSKLTEKFLSKRRKNSPTEGEKKEKKKEKNLNQSKLHRIKDH
jgi:hypothetical protein